MPNLTRSGRLQAALHDLLTQAPEVEAAAVVSFDGLPMASALPASMDEDRVAAMSAALLALGERAAEGLGRGELSQVFIEAAEGTVFLVSADNEAVLVAVAARGAKVGMMLFEVRRTAAVLADVLRREVDAPAPLAAVAPVVPLVPGPAASGEQFGSPLYMPVVESVPAPSYEPFETPCYEPSATWNVMPSEPPAEPASWS